MITVNTLLTIWGQCRAMSARPLTVSEAYRILDLTGPVSPAELSAAFRRVAKAVHPDQPNGDVVLFRYVVDAYHLLQKQSGQRLLLEGPQASALRVVRPDPEIVISPIQALKGGITSLYVDDRLYRVRLAPGLRHGDQLRLKDLMTVPVKIRPRDGLSVFGSDLFYQTRIEAHLVRDGGRVEFDTPVGPQSAWLVPDMTSPVRLRFEGLGLPARGSRPVGDLFVSLEAKPESLTETQDRHHRFTQLWTTQAAAA